MANTIGYYTKFPNSILEDNELSNAAMRTAQVIVRHSCGYGKKWALMKRSEICKKAAISPSSLYRALEELRGRGWVRTQQRGKDVHFELNLDNEVKPDQAKEEMSHNHTQQSDKKGPIEMEFFNDAGSVKMTDQNGSDVSHAIGQNDLPGSVKMTDHNLAPVIASVSQSTISESVADPLKKTSKEKDRSTNVEQSCIAGADAGDQRAGDLPSVPPKTKEPKPRVKAPRVPRAPKSVSPEEQSRLDEFHKLKREWMEAHELQFEERYGFTGRDGKAINTLLGFGTASEVLDVAIQAWSNVGRPGTFHVKHASSLYGLANHWNEIRSELRNLKASIIGVSRSSTHQRSLTDEQRDVIAKLEKIRFTSCFVAP